MKRSMRALGHAALLAIAAAVLPAPQGAAAPAAVQRNAWQTYPLTLITGHDLLVQELPGGRYAVSVAADASTPSYQTYAHGDDLYVIPDEAAPLVPERLDRELFNVATLVRAGYHDRERDELPLLLELAPGAASALPGITPTDQLESIDGTAAELDKDDADDLGAALEGGETGGVGAYTDTLGRWWSPDRQYAAGGFGYTNTSSEVRTTTRAIAGTDDDPLYRALRQNPGEYRFDGLPRGVYGVELHFAEIDNRKPGNRVFDVLAEGRSSPATTSPPTSARRRRTSTGSRSRSWTDGSSSASRRDRARRRRS